MSLSANREKFEELIHKWITIENSTIKSADELVEQSSNPYVKTMIEMLKMDSEKHRRMLETICQSLNSTVTFTTDDLSLVDSFVEKHAALEKHAIETAEQALEMGSLPIPRMMLGHILADEKKHDAFMYELNELKEYMAKDTD